MNRPQIIDTTLAAGAVSSPWWLVQFESAVGIAVALGGLTLVILRIVISWRELRRK